MKCITSNNLRILILLGCLSYTTVLAASKGDKNSKSPTPPTPSENHDASEGENINPRTLAHRIAVENIELHPVGIEAENRSEVRKRRGRKLSRGRVNAVSNKFISLDPEGMHLLNKIIKHPQHGAAAGILKLLTHRQVADALRAFKKLPPERRKEVVYSRYGGSIPKEYLVVTSRGIDKIPLTAGFLESLYQVFHNGNVHYVVHSVMNGMTYLVIGGLVLSEPVFLARIVLNDAQATILEGSVETGCGNSTNDPDFRFVDPVIGSFTQRLILTEAGLVQQAVFGSLIVLGPRVLRLPLMGGAVYLYRKVFNKLLKLYERRQARQPLKLDDLNDIQKKHLESPGFNKQALEKLLRNRIFQSAFDELKDDPERGLKFLAAYFSASKSERKIMCMSINGVGGNDEEAVRFPKLAKALQVDTSNTKDVPWTAGIFTSLYQLIYLGRSEYGAHIAGICVGSGVVIAAVVSLGAISPYLSVIGGASASIGIPGLLSENCSFWEEVGFPQFVTLTGPLETVFPSPEGAAVVTAINIITDVVLPTLITTMQVLTVGGVRNTQQLIMWVIYSLSHFGGLAEGLEDEAYSDGNSDLGSCFEDDLTDLPEVFERLYLTDNPDENDPANGIQVEIDIEPPVSHGANSEVTELGENVGNMSIEDVF